MAKQPETKTLADWLEKLENSHNKKIDLGLDRVRSVYHSLNLGKIAPTIITVAGTNGKGSTVAILSSICQKAGYKTGCFTSPHILKYNERIKVNDANCSDVEIIDAFEQIEKNLNGVTLSYFEYATLAALIIFKSQSVDVAILEVGLGGRLDSVNVVDTDCAIITTIDIDHVSWLGDNIESIGFEKAGIMRPGKPAIYGDQNCPNSIIKHAKSIGANLVFVGEEITVGEINLQGDYQIKNARTAITALHELSNELTIRQEHIDEGLKHVQINGRLQKLQPNPEIIVDVSHNEQAAKSLLKWLSHHPVKGKTIAVFSVLADKNPKNWVHLFKDTIDMWFISQTISERAMPKQELLKTLSESAQLICSFNTISDAFTQAVNVVDNDDRVLVFGSFYTVSEAMNAYAG